MLLKVGLAVADGPARIKVVIRGGKGWRAGRDLDNCLKAVMDALVHARRIEDDSTKYVHEIRISFQEAEDDKKAACLVSYVPDHH